MNSRLEREAIFHDNISKQIIVTDENIDYFLKQPSPATWFSDKLTRLNDKLLSCIGNVEGKKILIYGCGNDGAAIWFAKRGAHVDAIDISEMACKNQQEIITKSDLVDSINCYLMDAHNVTLTNKYDIIYGNAILHHLDIGKIRKEIYRLLNKGGIAIFRDVKQGNFFLRLFRKLTPAWRTADEHPLTEEDIFNLSQEFSQIEQSVFIFLLLPYLFFHRIMNNVILPKFGQWRLSRFTHYDHFDILDVMLFKIFPFLKKQAWICLIILRK